MHFAMAPSPFYHSTGEFLMDIPIYTYLHGANVLQRYRAKLTNEGLCQYQIEIARPTSNTFISFEYTNLDKQVDHSCLFLFEGFTITGGMTDKIISIPISIWTRDLLPLEAKREIRARSSEVFQPKLGDLTLYGSEDQISRYTDGNYTVQEIPLHLVIVPKSDVRFLFLTYKERSLEPVFKTVRVFEKELRIENATK